jgi:hypothetical protein
VSYSDLFIVVALFGVVISGGYRLQIATRRFNLTLEPARNRPRLTR